MFLRFYNSSLKELGYGVLPCCQVSGSWVSCQIAQARYDQIGRTLWYFPSHATGAYFRLTRNILRMPLSTRKRRVWTTEIWKIGAPSMPYVAIQNGDKNSQSHESRKTQRNKLPWNRSTDQIIQRLKEVKWSKLPITQILVDRQKLTHFSRVQINILGWRQKKKNKRILFDDKNGIWW